MARHASSTPFRHAPEANAPWVAPPAPIVVIEILFLAWLAVLLGIVVLDEQLAQTLASSITALVLFLIAGALIPIAVCYGVATNRAWSRIGSILGVVGVLAVLGYYFNVFSSGTRVPFFIASAGTIFLAGYFLYLHPASKNYYAIVLGQHPETADTVAKARASKPSSAAGSKLQSALEYAAIIVGLGIVVASFSQVYS